MVKCVLVGAAGVPPTLAKRGRGGLSKMHRNLGDHPAQRLSIETVTKRIIQPHGQHE
jgi:hypothetical protein